MDLPTPSFSATPLEQLLERTVNRRSITIGLPAPVGEGERRFPLTPEVAGLLVAHGFVVKMQASGADAIHYTDLKYQQQGVEITDRREAMRCDIVLYLSPLSTLDARMMRHGGMLFTMFDSVAANAHVLSLLLRNNVIAIALDLISDEHGHHPFADILAEISGRASIATASALLADSVHGKGILLGGIAGIVPCEVTIIGSGIDAQAAAISAIGLGASVRMFDNDIYRLRSALTHLGPGVSGSALHPRVLVNALHAADVVVSTAIKPVHTISASIVAEMKRGVIIFDLTNGKYPTFPSLRRVDLTTVIDGERVPEGTRVCYVNPGNTVPRTAAMALSNSFMTMINDVSVCDGMTNALMLNNGLQEAALTFMGKPVNEQVAAAVGLRPVSIKLLLQFS